ncbi:MAG: acetyl-CoA acetyltransferase [Deltaproteobacteria bacterium]|jgi:acetyl-CoA C-acetyltransferase|nr:acetyl-CoA acetyltransferase [Deltaproteobacteria bacterium]
MTPDPRTPVLVGAGQVLQRAEDPREAQEPLLLMAEAAERAAEDAGAPDLLRRLDAIRVPKGLWSYSNPGAWLAQRFGAVRPETQLGVISGTTVLKMLAESADDIQAGRRDAILVVGGEAEHSKRRARAQGFEVKRTAQEGPPPDRGMPEVFDWRNNPDIAAGLLNPTQCFGLFEVALRHRRGESVEAHRRRIAELWARFARVAADNPNAWVRDAPDAGAIAEPVGGNRVVAAPYTKYMVANMVVDQAAALLLTSVGTAASLGIPEERWVYPWVATQADVGKHLSDRGDLAEEGTIRLAGRRALERAGTAPEELGPVDLYSCFPSAVQLAQQELGLGEDATPTVTGGLTFAGGPFNNYVIHALATTMERLRKEGERPGFQSAVGGFMARHAFAVLGREPRAGGFESLDLSDETTTLPGRTYLADYTGPVTIESYVVPYAADAPERAVVAARTPEGARCWARSEEADLLAAMVEEEFCGREAFVDADREIRISASPT